MCGITGIYLFNKKHIEKLDAVYVSCESLIPRGPDFNAVFSEFPTALGHTRLSILDTSELGHQPMKDVTGRYIVIYNGEIYNYKELRRDLEKLGHDFFSNTDTEVLLKMYTQYGADCLNKLNGFFAFAIYDRLEKELFIARDRYGIKPLYYSINENFIAFSSEIKGLKPYGIDLEIDKTALYTYFQLNYIPGERSIYSTIKKLDPGHFIKIKEKDIKISRYYSHFDAQNSSESTVSYAVAKSKIRSLLESSVEYRMVSDVPLGCFLSGGLDSSIISMLAAKHNPALNTFSIGYKDEPFFDETAHAEEVARHIGSHHHTFSLSNVDLFEHLFSAIDYFDEPFADSSALAVYIISKLSRKEVKVILSGDGADELFGGYNKHRAEYLVRSSSGYNSLLSFLHPILSKLPQSRNSFVGNSIRKAVKMGDGLSMTRQDRYWQWASILSAESASQLLRNTGDVHEYSLLKNNFTGLIKETGAGINDVLLADQKLVLPNDMLTKVDLMSMANGLEVRVPFLDHGLVNYVNGLSSDFKINKDFGKVILRDIFKPDLPESIFSKPKHGFEVPLLKWMQKELYSLLFDDFLSDSFVDEQGLFNKGYIHQLKTRLFSKNPGDVHATLWALLVFQNWWKKKHLASK